VLISSLPFDEDINAFVRPTDQEKNMMSCDPFEDIDDTLLHDFEMKKYWRKPWI
jgi:hypothetical protein